MINLLKKQKELDKKLTNLEKGMLPPQALDIEAAIISAMLIDAQGVEDAMLLMKEDYFYSPKLQKIFKAIKSLYDSNHPVDLVTVSNKLKSLKTLDGIGGDMELIKLTQKVASAAHIEFHCRIVLEKYLKRKIISVSSEAIKKAYDDAVDVFDLIDFSGQSLDAITAVISTGSSSMSWYDAMMNLPKRVEFLTNNQGKITGLPTGLDATDKHFSGWQPTDFIVIGADSGMGKTALAMEFLLAPAREGKAVGMFSMEMSVQQLAIRGTAVESDFHMNQLMRTGFEKQEYFATLLGYVDKMKDYPIYIDDKPALTVPEMKRKARAMKRKNNIQLLVIDFLQMFSGDKEVRINVGEAARECKNLAKELNIPVIGLSQISREVRKSKYFIPKKFHLKEASAIEEAADIIGMLYRPSYYGFEYASSPELYDDVLGLQGSENAVLMVEKNRNGSLGNVGLQYIENKTKFVNGVASVAASDDNPF
jgi:replicative DNA helicase